MTPTIDMKPLSQKKRQIVFGLSILLFVIAVPISVFYAIGYRFDFTDQITSIKSVGGMYVRNDAPDTSMFVDDMPVVDMRVFQKAAYIQNLEAGMHRIHVQGDKVQTWVKELPVYAHFVTEVASFNLPRVPQIRPITKWKDSYTGHSVVFGTATSSPYRFASSTEQLFFSTSTATSTLTENAEYLFVKSLFASSTQLQIEAQKKTALASKKNFSFDVATTALKASIATSTKMWRDFILFEQGDSIAISWNGDANHIPYYYCLNYKGEKETLAEYGSHVYDTLVAAVASSSELATKEGEQVCRKSIEIDHQNKQVKWFDFYPDTGDIVLLDLDDGLYAVEVDDRGWQNAQLLYPGTDIRFIQDGGRIYLKDGKNYLEVFTDIISR